MFRHQWLFTIIHQTDKLHRWRQWGGKKGEHLDRLWHQDFAAGLLVAALPSCICVGMWMWGGFWHLVSAIFWKLHSFSSVSTAYLVISYLSRAGRGNNSAGRCHDFTQKQLECVRVQKSCERKRNESPNFLGPLVFSFSEAVCTYTHTHNSHLLKHQNYPDGQWRLTFSHTH